VSGITLPAGTQITLAALTTTHSTHTTAALPTLGAAFTAAVLLTARHRMNPGHP
jgi:hypothetical protein